jgi:pimeloyl-ACP methyl ester carboxylesterase
MSAETSGTTANGCCRRQVLGAGALLASGLVAGLATHHRGWAMEADSQTGYATIDGLQVYYEVHGGGADRDRVPIVLLHGGALTIEIAFAQDLIPRFAAGRPVIAIEQQGHGHTGDRPGPMTIGRMVEDTAGVLVHLGVRQADLFGHSLGGMIATGVAIRHPAVVRSATIVSAPHVLEGFLPDLVRIQRDPTQVPSPSLIPLLPTEADLAAWRASFERSAPDPTAFDQILARLNAMLAEWPGWSEAELRGIPAPVLVVIGDNDYVRIDHAAEMAQLIPDARLAVLPGTTHLGITGRGAWLEAMIAARLEPAL